MAEIKKVGVLGAGVMGAGIAAHLTNAGVPVVLLDIVPEGAKNRDAIAEDAVKKLLKADPAAFMHKRNAKLITTGNIEDHLDRVADCDWIIEAVIEKLDAKHAIYGKIDAVRKPGSIVSSNTSTIPLAVLCEGMPAGFARDFLITHFFNPPRYMRLLELVAGEKTRADALQAVRRFADVALGKGVVDCKDTPGFIANRIGIYWLQCGVLEAMEAGLTVEEADLVCGRPMGIPRTGVFGLLDLVGLDLMPHVLGSLAGALPETDAFHAVRREPELIGKMIADGYTGRKGKGGFYRLDTSSGKRVKEAIDLETGAYHPAQKPRLDSVEAATDGGLRALMEHPDKGGRYAWRVMARTLSYAAHLAPEIAGDIVAVDEAMRLGFNWKSGPFQLIDQLGPAWFAEKLKTDGLPVPDLLETVGAGTFYRTDEGRPQHLAFDGGYTDVRRATGVLLLSDVKLRSEPVARNASASLWDIGDGVVCLEFHTKMNALDLGTLAMVGKAVRIVADGYQALVIYNEGSNFSAGANLGLMLFAANLAAWPMIEDMLVQGQDAYKALKYAPFPVVGAPAGMALGGGCEILLHCDAVQAHAEFYVGLVETGVGVVPAWGGCKEMLVRWSASPLRPRGFMPPVIKVFETVGTATVARSAPEARDLLYLGADDGITMNRDRLLADAKARALDLVDGYTPPEPPEISLPGPAARVALTMVLYGLRKLGKATPHDEVVAKALAGVLSGDGTDVTESLTEDDLLALERRAFMELVRHPATIARIEHMLDTGKPLRN
ncbi:MAG: 3-hydroxyacyl-CoA dehydrogenase NAD-binding domain-containing protein [Alphaproteobacteria bacterium]|nr:3-hydroxyacyl-CoA dehydrogenase NAD-binding domain-containing protein [Alphaproteobacteria bacterium]